MIVPMAEEVARERRSDALKRAELHRLARISRVDQTKRHRLLVNSIRAGLVSMAKNLRANVNQPIVE
jgi:hypothetical protein